LCRSVLPPSLGPDISTGKFYYNFKSARFWESPPPSGLKSKLAACYMFISCLAYSSFLKMEAIRSSVT
jgi:hypothetical protein